MKKYYILILILILLSTTGCTLIKSAEMEGIDIITSIYPIEYVSQKIYGELSNIISIYPKDANLNEYELTSKQINDLSDNDLFIYNGSSNEREYATTMLNKNKDLMIIDASYGIDIINSKYDIWLNPSNILMIAQNIRNELFEYISSPYIIEKINTNYDDLRTAITKLDTEYKKTADNSINATIICYDQSLAFLEKYGFTVINLTSADKNNDENIETAKELIKNKKNTYVFQTEYTKDNDLLKEFTALGAKNLIFRTLEIINEKDIDNNDDYLSIMYANIEQIKEETYK